MNDVSREAFEAWAKSEEGGNQSCAKAGAHDLGRTYWSYATDEDWQSWRASRKQALAEYTGKLQAELDHAAINDHRMAPQFGRMQGDTCVRVGNIEAVIFFMKESNES